MSRNLRIVLFVVLLGVFGAIGYGIWVATDSTTAAYIVGVAGTAVGAAALVLNGGGKKEAGAQVSAQDHSIAAGHDVRVGHGGIHTGADHGDP
jgi:hypothetical protein